MPRKGIDINIAASLYESGKGLRECCEQLGLKSHGSLYARLVRHGVRMRSKSESRSMQLDTEYIKELYTDIGCSSVSIANEIGVSHATVISRLNSSGVRVRSSYDGILVATSEIDKATRVRAIELRYRENITTRQISERLDIPLESLKGVFRRTQDRAMRLSRLGNEIAASRMDISVDTFKAIIAYIKRPKGASPAQIKPIKDHPWKPSKNHPWRERF
jgi:hypothetical protein